MRPAKRLLSLLLATCLLLPAALLARFSETLASDQLSYTGLARLNSDQIACLDALVQRELALAKQGRTKGFAKTFTTRRTEREIEITGLQSLSDEERKALDTLIEAQLAATPMTPASSATTPASTVTMKDPRPAVQVHGSVSLFVGGNSHGGSFYEGAMETTVSNNSGTLALTLGYAEVHGRRMGCHGLYPWDEDLPYLDRSTGPLLTPNR